MTTPMRFDAVEKALRDLLSSEWASLNYPGSLVAIRDVFGRVRFLVDKRPSGTQNKEALKDFATKAKESLGARAYDPAQAFLYRDELAADIDAELQVARCLDDVHTTVRFLDRQVTGQAWATVSQTSDEMSSDARRIAFYSLKGGVGRSTAAAVVAWNLANQGKEVLVLDLDIEAPGLSTSLLPPDRQPDFGIVDWFVEDAVGQGSDVVQAMVSESPLARDLKGQIRVAPSHGAKPGDYLAKLGRCYLDLPKPEGAGRETWMQRLVRLVGELERVQKPDVVLLDVRAGLQDLSSVPVTDLGAEVLFFAIDTAHTWAGYRLLFEHWRRAGSIREIRERLRIVAAMVPETDRSGYLEGFRERAWNLFRDHAYDEIAPSTGDTAEQEAFSFDLADATAPHAPLPIYWNRGFASLANLHALDATVVRSAFDVFLGAIDGFVARDPGGEA